MLKAIYSELSGHTGQNISRKAERSRRIAFIYQLKKNIARNHRDPCIKCVGTVSLNLKIYALDFFVPSHIKKHYIGVVAGRFAFVISKRNVRLLIDMAFHGGAYIYICDSIGIA